MINKYKVGDIIQLKRTNECSSNYRGSIGLIKSIHKGSLGFDYGVELVSDNGTKAIWFVFHKEIEGLKVTKC